ncbi:MAG TPA: Rne/Rng family ribonuclease [Terriglobia bacterium]|nr:Rne/Rng family ribonuclease [Terriglobia bacterium]
MNKEMFISSSPHETKVAVCEDGQLVEVYFERDTDVGLVGGIYKGRVNRVLPGMQSAFVDIGLERDAFLYVSDFSLQDQDEFEGVLDEAHARPATIEVEPQKPAADIGAAAGSEKPEESERVATGGLAVGPAEPEETTAPAEAAMPSYPEASRQQSPDSAAGPAGEGKDFRHRSHRGRRRRGRHGRHGDRDRRQNHYPEPQAEAAKPEAPKPQVAAEPEDFEVLPGESLAKYRHPSSEKPAAVESSFQRGVEKPGSEPTTNVEETASAGSAYGAEEVNFETRSENAPERPRTDTISDRYSASSGIDEAEGYEADSEEEADAASGSAAWPGTEDEEGPPAEELASAGQEFERQAGTSTAPDELSRPEDKSENEEQAEGSAPSGGEGSDERSYTLREPHARPHFAPRRGRRGRRRAGRHPRRGPGRERESSRAGSQQGLQISELLKEGQEIIVQIAKEPLGTKGARITSHVALPGRYVVYMPTITHIGVSRKIASEQERLRLRNIVMEHKGALGGGFIVRTAGEGRTEEEIKADLQFLTNLWNDVRTRAEKVKAPSLLYRDLDLAQRLMRDLVTPDFKSIWLDNEADYERVVEFINRLQPSLVGCAKLHTRSNPLFEEHGIEDEIEKALKPKVWLKSGGYIVINQTEALVAIDVNTGKYVGKTNRLEDTIVKTNIDAVNEIVRQIRLRDLGGIIVIDFIDMDERRNRNKVVQALEEAMRRDRAPTKVLSFNDFGLVAVTRKRVKQSLERTLCDPCAYCNGSGWVKSVSTVTNEILAEARKMAEEIEGKTITLRVNPEVAQELKSKEGTFVQEIEALTHKNLVIKSDPSIHQERFEIF